LLSRSRQILTAARLIEEGFEFNLGSHRQGLLPFYIPVIAVFFAELFGSAQYRRFIDLPHLATRRWSVEQSSVAWRGLSIAEGSPGPGIVTMREVLTGSADDWRDRVMDEVFRG
jgi:hypothetical protein